MRGASLPLGGNTTYYWRVQGFSGTTSGEYSSIRSFTTVRPTGTLTASAYSCTILAGQAKCTVNISWNTANPVNTSAITSNYPSFGYVEATGNSYISRLVDIPYGGRDFFLYNDEIELAKIGVDATCTAGTTWSGSVCAGSAKGSLNVSVKNANGGPAVGVAVLRYGSNWAPIDTRLTDGAGIASWSNIDATNYKLNVYSDGEFWASGSASVPTGGIANVTLQRNEPYAYEFRVFTNDNTNVTGETVPTGTQLRYEVKVRNLSSGSRTVRVIFNADRDKASPYDATGASEPQPVQAGGETIISFSHTPSSIGAYYRSFVVETYETNGYERTDFWDWAVAVNVDDLQPDPYGVGLLEPSGIGLFATIPIANRNNLVDLQALANNQMLIGTRPVDSRDRKLVIAIHGWAGITTSDGEPLVGISSRVNARVNEGYENSDWAAIAYDWSRDAATWIVYGSQPVQTNGILATTADGEPVVSEELWLEGGATQAAEVAYQHGLMLGFKIVQQVGSENLKAVHLIGHSAGSWAVYGALRYLYAHTPIWVSLQATYLDAYIPADMVLSSNANFKRSMQEASPTYCRVNGDNVTKAEHYWADDPRAYGTNTPFTFTSGPSVTFRTDGSTYGDLNWDTHGGPVDFYEDTVSNPQHAYASGHGWKHSLAYNEPTTVTINQATGQADPTASSPVNFTVVFSRPIFSFDSVDVGLTGTAGATTPVITGGPQTFNVAVSGMKQSGTVAAYIVANGVRDYSGRGNEGSTTSDNVVTYAPPCVEMSVCREAVDECDVRESCFNGICPPDAKKDSGTSCTSDSNACTVDQCNGSSPTCQHAPGNAGATCRLAVGPCDASETCTGSSDTCPADVKQTNGTPCSDNVFCNGTESCSNGVCQDQVDPCPSGLCNESTKNCSACVNGQVCRPAIGPCDVEEKCSSNTCPPDGLVSSATTCRGAAGVCDVAERCTGAGPSCPADTFSASSTVCRAATGVCDAVEYCIGTSAACPGDGLLSTSSVCRSSAGLCDAEERCSGGSTACPVDVLASTATVCRAAAGPCDVEERCTGGQSQCPANTFATPAIVCRVSRGSCDLTETCTGTAAACPADAVASSLQLCRASAGICDPVERCSGSSADCPADSFSGSSVPCRGSSGVCDLVEYCNGSNASCPVNTYAPTSTVCRASLAACDAAERCPGTGALCPIDAMSPPSVVCRLAVGPCDVAEHCMGNASNCPADVMASTSVTCRSVAGSCDVAERCSGTSANCPNDLYRPDSQVCRASIGDCDIAEQCTGGLCPPDAVKSNVTPCASDADVCTDDVCDGRGACIHSPAGPLPDPTVVYSQQPGAEGQDTHWGVAVDQDGNPDSPTLSFGGSRDPLFDYLRFSLEEAPPSEMVSRAEIWLYAVDAPAKDPKLEIYRITEPWEEAAVSSLENPASTFFASVGPLNMPGWNKLDVSDLYDSWRTGAAPNYGIELVPGFTQRSNGLFASSDNPDPELRPKLVVWTSAPPCDDGDACTQFDVCAAGACSGWADSTCSATCGDANSDGMITASDALMALRAATGTAVCLPSRCDYNGDGVVSASDALAILRTAVGRAGTPRCGAL